MKKFKYHDKLASKRRQRFHVKSILIGLAVLMAIGGISYALFYAPWLKITNITFEGLSGGHQDDMGRVVNDTLNHKTLGVPISRDILFLRSGSLIANLTSQFSFIEDISIDKDYFNTIKITVTERQAEGVWCFNPSTGQDCRYFDNSGVTFGQAIQSSGVLLLNVDDMRTQSASASLATVDQRFLKAIQTVAPILTSQDVKVKNITIPKGTYTEFDVLVSDGSAITSAYPVKLSIDSDLPSQLDIFRIFRVQKMANGMLHPQYIDLRFDGRVYFK